MIYRSYLSSYHTTNVSALLIIGTRNEVSGMALRVRQMMEKANQLHWDGKVLSWVVKQVAIMEPESTRTIPVWSLSVKQTRIPERDLHSGQRGFHEHVNKGASLSAWLLQTETLTGIKSCDTSSTEKIHNNLAVLLFIIFLTSGWRIKAFACQSSEDYRDHYCFRKHTGGINLITVRAQTLLI